jgi:hypothetical protein
LPATAPSTIALFAAASRRWASRPTSPTTRVRPVAPSTTDSCRGVGSWSARRLIWAHSSAPNPSVQTSGQLRSLPRHRRRAPYGQSCRAAADGDQLKNCRAGRGLDARARHGPAHRRLRCERLAPSRPAQHGPGAGSAELTKLNTLFSKVHW